MVKSYKIVKASAIQKQLDFQDKQSGIDRHKLAMDKAVAALNGGKMSSLALEIVQCLNYFGSMQIPAIVEKMNLRTRLEKLTPDLIEKELAFLVQQREVYIANGMYVATPPKGYR